jgi:hypothetical protein
MVRPCGWSDRHSSIWILDAEYDTSDAMILRRTGGCIVQITEELDTLSDNDEEWIMGRGIAEWLGWLLPCT